MGEGNGDGGGIGVLAVMKMLEEVAVALEEIGCGASGGAPWSTPKFVNLEKKHFLKIIYRYV